MSGCLACTAPIAPCTCTASQTCLLTLRTCTECNVAFCQDNAVAAPASGSNGGGANLGTTVGAAVGGVSAVLLAVGVGYWFWWRPLSRRRHQRMQSQYTQQSSKTNARKSLVLPTSTEQRRVSALPAVTGGNDRGEDLLTGRSMLSRVSEETERPYSGVVHSVSCPRVIIFFSKRLRADMSIEIGSGNGEPIWRSCTIINSIGSNGGLFISLLPALCR